MTEQEIIEQYGKRCAEPNPDCVICDMWAMFDRIEAQAARIAELEEALGLADAALRGARMNMKIVERKVTAALTMNKVTTFKWAPKLKEQDR